MTGADIQRMQGAAAADPAHAPEPRILVLAVSPDASTAYVPLMNAIFAAQKLVRARGRGRSKC
jgi:hypothetical protein